MTARVLVLATLVALGVARDATAGARDVAGRLDDERAQCDFLIMLCREANRAVGHAADTPGGAELLAEKHGREAQMHVQDAYDAADAIAAKHPPGKRPWCFSAPDCTFLKDRRAR